MTKYALLSVTLLFGSLSMAQTIATIAGGGPRNLNPLQVGLAQPAGVAVDSSGNVYVSLAQVQQVWKINTSSQVTVFAGNGSFPFDTDGVQATSATLYQPRGLAFDSSGNLYIADTGHNRVRKVSTSGVISTVAGTGAAGFSGDGGAATSAQLNSPLAVAVDSSNNLYIADYNNYRVRVVSAGGTISTLAGNGTAGFSGDGGAATSATLNGPVGVAVDSSGNVFIADQTNLRIRKVTSGIITTFAGNGTFGLSGDGGPPTSAQLNNIAGVAVDPFNNVYVEEAFDIRKITVSSNTISTFAGNGSSGYSGDGGSPTSAMFQNIAAAAFDSSGTTLYLVDAGNSRIRKIASNVTSTFAGNGTLDFDGDGQSATNANFLTPSYVTTDNAGSLLFGDSGSSSIRKLTLSSGLLSTVAGNGLLSRTADGGAVTGPAYNPTAFNFDSSGNIYYLEENRVRKISGGVYSTIANTSNVAGFSGDGGAATSARFNMPLGLARAANGDLYVADSTNNRVRLISAATGIVSTVVGTGTASSTGDGGLGVNATVNYPSSLSLDGAGNLFISELSGNRIRKLVLSTNAITTVAGDGTSNFADGVAATSTGLSGPTSVFADQSSNLFIADQGHSRVRKVTSATGLISTVAGNGIYDFTGDGGSPTSAAVNALGVTVDRSQVLYIADSSGRIRSTTVNACFFTFSAPTIYVNKSAQTGSITVTATNSSCNYSVFSDSGYVTITSGASGTGSGTITFSIAANTGFNRTATINAGGQSVALTQAGPLSPDKPGVFRSGYFWILDVDGNLQISVPPDRAFAYGGIAGDIPISGDWNGDGRTKVGIYRPSNGLFILDSNDNGQFDAGDAVYNLGVGLQAGDLPVVGDWNGDGRTKVGLFRQGFFWILDYNGDGVFNGANDQSFAFGGVSGDVPIVGDWSGTGTSKVGIFRQGFYWILDYNGNRTIDNVNQTGGDKAFPFGGISGDVPIVGDWNGSGTTKVGVFRQGFFWVLDANGNMQFDGTGSGQDLAFPFGGISGDKPVIGRW